MEEFKSVGVDGAFLLTEMDDESLEELGVTSKIQKRRIFIDNVHLFNDN